MNYITHLNKTFEVFCEDERLTPFHISLYYSLFQYWNMARFRNPISVSRNELMRASKIGSVNTYIRCIKELDTWQYIKYIPSYNPQKGSQVYLYSFNNSNDNSNNNGSDISNSKGSNKAGGKASEMQVIPYTNNSNIVNKINSVNDKKQKTRTQPVVIKNLFNDDNSKSNSKSEPKKEKEMPFAFADTEKSTKNSRQKSSAKKERSLSGRAKPRPERPILEEVKNYFAQNNYPSVEADKFYNHYESNGWLVGGKTPMKNWEASANNWILNSNKFNDGKTNSTNNKTNSTGCYPERSRRTGNLQTTTGKDYSEPL